MLLKIVQTWTVWINNTKIIITRLIPIHRLYQCSGMRNSYLNFRKNSITQCPSCFFKGCSPSSCCCRPQEGRRFYKYPQSCPQSNSVDYMQHINQSMLLWMCNPWEIASGWSIEAKWFFSAMLKCIKQHAGEEYSTCSNIGWDTHLQVQWGHS